MSEVKLGQLAPPDASRDAIHVAVVPCVAGQNLGRGWAVSIDKEGKAWAASMDDYVGVVDPFKGDSDDTGLGYPVRAGERFWLLLKPGTVSNLRHSWAHPLFPDAEEKQTPTADTRAISKAWLDAWCQARETQLEHLSEGIQSGHVCFGLDDWRGGMLFNASTDEYELPEEFWQHYITYTGKARPSGVITFRCAC